MAVETILIGVGGFGREVLDVIEAYNQSQQQGSDMSINVMGVVDDSPSELNLRRISKRGLEYLGSLDTILGMQKRGTFLLGIGSPVTRKVVAERLENAGWQPQSVIHPAATIGSVTEIGPGSVICGGVQLSTNTSLGRYVHLNPNSTIGHDTILEDFVSVNPGAVVSGEVIIKSQTLIGAGSIILQQIVVGSGAIVGAGACVTKAVPAKEIVVGIPAQPMGTPLYTKAHGSHEVSEDDG